MMREVFLQKDRNELAIEKEIIYNRFIPKKEEKRMGYDYSYSFDSIAPDFSQIDESVLMIILMVLLGIILFALMIGILTYVLTAAGMHQIAKRRGIQNPWLAWIPVADLWILGSISDQYQYLVKGKNTKHRFILVILYVVMFVTSSLQSFSSLGTMISETSAMTGNGAGFDETVTITMGLITLGLAFVTLAASIVQVIFRYIALYNLYASCKPQQKDVFLVVGILINITEPFFIFSCRKHDGGMPPRKVTVPVQPQQPVVIPAPEEPQPVPAEPVEPQTEE